MNLGEQNTWLFVSLTFRPFVLFLWQTQNCPEDFKRWIIYLMLELMKFIREQA